MPKLSLENVASFTPSASSKRTTDATANVVQVALARPDLNGKGVMEFLKSQNAYDGDTSSGIGVKVTCIHETLKQLASGNPVTYDGKQYVFRPVEPKTEVRKAS